MRIKNISDETIEYEGIVVMVGQEIEIDDARGQKLADTFGKDKIEIFGEPKVEKAEKTPVEVSNEPEKKKRGRKKVVK